MAVSTAEIVSLVLCLIGSGFYSGSEAILMSIGIDRARQLIEEGGAKGKALSFMVEKPNELLTTILVGNNVVNIWLASLSTVIASRIFESDVIGIVVGITTIAILIFGEIIPKTFGRRNAELLSLPVIRILQINYYILLPVVNAITWLTNVILGENANLTGRLITKNDIEYLINRAEKEKTMDSKQIDMIASILEFPTIKVKDIMIPRSKVKYIPSEFSFDEVIDYVSHDVHSRYPVAKGDLDHCLGFLHVKDLAFLTEEEKNDFDINNSLKAPFFVYEHMKIQAVFDHMNRKKVHLALVKDENGLTVGIITLEDIVEEVLGEIQDEHDHEEKKALDEYKEMDLLEGIIVEGSMSLRDLYNDFEIKIPLNDNYSTIAGFILDMLGNNFPEEGQIIVWEGLSFELIKVENHIIKKLKIKDVDGEKHFFSKAEAISNADDDVSEGENREN